MRHGHDVLVVLQIRVAHMVVTCHGRLHDRGVECHAGHRVQHIVCRAAIQQYVLCALEHKDKIMLGRVCQPRGRRPGQATCADRVLQRAAELEVERRGRRCHGSRRSGHCRGRPPATVRADGATATLTLHAPAVLASQRAGTDIARLPAVTSPTVITTVIIVCTVITVVSVATVSGTGE